MIDLLGHKEIFTALGIIFMSISYIIYLSSMYKGEAKPHPFSWFIWGLLTAIAFFAQISDGAGVGAIIMGLSSIITFGISIIAYIKRDNIIISHSDKWAFGLSLLAIPLWLFTETPLWSVILITLIDAAAFYPTYRKSWNRPDQESSISYALGGIKHLFTILALQNYSIITALFPLSLVITNLGLIVLIFFRRKVITHHEK